MAIHHRYEACLAYIAPRPARLSLYFNEMHKLGICLAVEVSLLTLNRVQRADPLWHAPSCAATVEFCHSAQASQLYKHPKRRFGKELLEEQR
ncbi:hypothetical protein M8818_005318 [Zalaria obscura]|uniref:Uncharacterized protein n=1 Tax=Zalaria obscura TaxID=2024903 RepID=A0ACC3S9Q8_9PEZI